MTRRFHVLRSLVPYLGAHSSSRAHSIAQSAPDLETTTARRSGRLLADLEASVRKDTRRGFRIRRSVKHGLIGFILGYLLLHPLTMFVFDWMGVHPAGEPLLLCMDWLSRSFSPEMIPMGIVFGLLSMLVGGIDGYYRSLVHFQRDELARHVKLIHRQHRELERQYSALRALELSKRRTTQFLVHDLKNHVGCVLGYASRLLTRAEMSGWRNSDMKSLETIRRQAKRMAGALMDMLELARLEEMTELKLEAIAVKGLLRLSVAEAALGPGEGTVELDEDIREDLILLGDRLLLERVIANLLLNAFQHNGADVRVMLGASRKDREIWILCRDTGTGIPAAIRDQLFEEFASGGQRNAEVPSYGLGLAFCKAVATAHGGRIWFETVEGEGTCFFFSLPALPTQGGAK